MLIFKSGLTCELGFKERPLEALSISRLQPLSQIYTQLGYTLRWTLCMVGKTSLQLSGHHKSKQKCDLLCSVLHATEK